MKTIAVFFGGQAVEHEVSVITGVLTLNSLDKEKFIPVPIFVDKNGKWFTGKQLFDLDNYKKLNYQNLTPVTLVAGDNALFAMKNGKLKKIANIAVAVNCMHGERGEDGCLFGLLNMCGVPLASPDLAPSSVCMDKTLTKIFLSGIGVKALDSVTVSGLEQIDNAISKLRFPMIVKPNKLGSSIGISKAENREELERGVLFALKYGERAIIEPMLEDFFEINCAAYLDGCGEIKVSECERPVARTDILTFKDKYESGKRIFPADISEKLSNEIKRITKKVYSELAVRGIIRIDFFVVKGKVFVNEINTVPGSLAYYLFSDTLKGFSDILTDLIRVAEKDFAASSTFIKTYSSGVLNFAGSKGGKR